MRLPFLISLAIWTGTTLPAFSAGQTAQLNLAACHVPSAGTLTNDAAFAGPHAETYKHYLVICPVSDPQGVTILQILALRADRAAEDNKLYFVNGQPWNGVNGAELDDADPIPRPVILTTASKVIGVLPELLFPDGPGTASVSFSDWHDRMPQRISIRVNGAAVLSSYCPPPLIWNAKAARYIEKSGPRFQACQNQ